MLRGARQDQTKSLSRSAVCNCNKWPAKCLWEAHKQGQLLSCDCLFVVKERAFFNLVAILIISGSLESILAKQNPKTFSTTFPCLPCPMGEAVVELRCLFLRFQLYLFWGGDSSSAKCPLVMEKLLSSLSSLSRSEDQKWRGSESSRWVLALHLLVMVVVGSELGDKAVGACYSFGPSPLTSSVIWSARCCISSNSLRMSASSAILLVSVSAGLTGQEVSFVLPASLEQGKIHHNWEEWT